MVKLSCGWMIFGSVEETWCFSAKMDKVHDQGYLVNSKVVPDMH